MKRLGIPALLSLQISFLSLSFACTSLTDQGDELFEKGLYLEAEKTYSAALQKDANDPVALEGLQKSRVKILDVGLIEVRMLRLANNHLAAADKLEDILQKQANWKVRFTSAVAETQKVETARAKEFLIEEMNREVDAGFAERSYWLGYYHKNVLENTGPSPDLDNVRNKISNLGKQRCSEHQKLPTTKDVFLRSFVSRYCGLFGVTWTSTSQVNDPWLFSSVKFANNYDVQKVNFSGNLNSQSLESAFIESFQKSPYFHPLSKQSLNLSMSGKLSYVDQRTSERRRKEYKRKEERIETVTSKDPQGNLREEKVKKDVFVPKVFEYFVTIHDESANFESKVTGTIDNKPYRSHAQKSATKTSESHNERNQEAAISPQKASLMNVNDWFANQFRETAQIFEADLNKLWGQHFCTLVTEIDPNNVTKSNSWEMLERCGRVEANNQIVSTFYRNKFHLDYAEFWSLLKDGQNQNMNPSGQTPNQTSH